MAGQALNATFFALRKREKSGVLTTLSIVYLVVTLAVFGAFIAINYQTLGAAATWYGQVVSSAATGATPQIDAASMPPGLPMFFVTLIPFMFAFYVLFAAYEAGCLRWLVRGETGGLAGLSFGADTWRVYLSYWMWVGLYLAFSLVFSILTIVAAGIGVAASGGSTSMLAASVPLLLISLVRLVLMVFFGVRLAPAAATSVGMKRFAFFDAWTVTKGRFWPLLGAFLLVFVLVIIAEIVIFGLVFGVIGFAAFQSSDPSTIMATLLAPQNLMIIGAAYVVFLLFTVFIYLLMFGINARAVIAAAEDGKITGVNAESLAQTFT